MMMNKLKIQAVSVYVLALAIIIIACMISHAYPKDYSQNSNHEWVHNLHSPAGSWCCDITDGHALVDGDWQTKDGHYQVKIENAWIDVPKDAVIEEPNKIGQTIVWYLHKDGLPVVNCFLPGAMT